MQIQMQPHAMHLVSFPELVQSAEMRVTVKIYRHCVNNPFFDLTFCRMNTEHFPLDFLNEICHITFKKEVK